MHALTALALATLILAPIPSQAAAWWYARQESDTRYAGCFQAEDSVDEIFAHVSEGWARASQGKGSPCTVMRRGPEALAGFGVDCAEGGVHLFFRSLANCNAFVKAINDKRVADPEDYVPEGVKNKPVWLSVYGMCLDGWIHSETVKRGALQVTATLCECWAGKVSGSETEPSKELLGTAGKACLDAVPRPDQAKLVRPKEARPGATGKGAQATPPR